MNNKLFTKSIKKEKYKNENNKIPGLWTTNYSPKQSKRKNTKREFMESQRVFNSLHSLNCEITLLLNQVVDYQANKYKKLTHVYGRVYLKYFFTLANAKSQLARLITKFTSGCSLALCDVDFFTSRRWAEILVQSWCWCFTKCFNYDPGIWLILRVRGGS